MEFDTEFLKALKRLQNPKKIAGVKFRASLALLDLTLRWRHIYQRAKREVKSWVK